MNKTLLITSIAPPVDKNNLIDINKYNHYNLKLMDFEISNVKNIYENIAYEFSDKRYTKWDWIDEFINSFSNNSNMLDVGCGNGRNMINTNHNFFGVDNCEQFIKLANERKLQVTLSDMTSLPFINNYFD